jgi:hypothetical protein
MMKLSTKAGDLYAEYGTDDEGQPYVTLSLVPAGQEKYRVDMDLFEKQELDEWILILQDISDRVRKQQNALKAIPNE